MAIHIRRRDFITLLGGAAAAWPLAARGQQAERIRRIGVLVGFAASDVEAQARVTAFRQKLQELGWTEGSNVRIHERWAAGDAERMRSYAAELVGLEPDVIVGVAVSAVIALRRATRSIAIVFTQVSDPIGSGLIESVALPGGNVTGFTNFESTMGSKWLELLKEIAPSVKRAAFIFNPKTAAGQGSFYLRPFEAAALALEVESVAAPVDDAAEIEKAIAVLGREPGGGLVVMPDAFTLVHRESLVDLATRHRLPAVYPFRFFATRGGLVSYGINPTEQFPRAATYVDRILKGAKPNDLPVQAPTKFELVINLKTAKALGLDVPPMLLARADEVIE